VIKPTEKERAKKGSVTPRGFGKGVGGRGFNEREGCRQKKRKCARKGGERGGGLCSTFGGKERRKGGSRRGISDYFNTQKGKRGTASKVGRENVTGNQTEGGNHLYRGKGKELHLYGKKGIVEISKKPGRKGVRRGSVRTDRFLGQKSRELLRERRTKNGHTYLDKTP